jgi:phospholipase/carboxylesterase
MEMHTKEILTMGKPISQAAKVLIMLHGRGASAEDILSLSEYLHINDFALVAPRAANNTWYPLSFLAPSEQNEPWLSSAINLVDEMVHDINQQKIDSTDIYFLGFSQGACLTLEFVTRNAQKYGGVVAFTGGLIGDKIYEERYKGDFQQTPIFIGTSDPDPHVPLERVNETSSILKKMNADLTLKVYRNMGHTISRDEIDNVNKFIFSD